MIYKNARTGFSLTLTVVYTRAALKHGYYLFMCGYVLIKFIKSYTVAGPITSYLTCLRTEQSEIFNCNNALVVKYYKRIRRSHLIFFFFIHNHDSKP